MHPLRHARSRDCTCVLDGPPHAQEGGVSPPGEQVCRTTRNGKICPAQAVGPRTCFWIEDPGGRKWTLTPSRCVSSSNGQGPVVHLAGELDVATASTLRRCLVRLEGQSVTLDFSGVTFMDSRRDRCFVAARNRAERDGTTITLQNVQAEPLRVLKLLASRSTSTSTVTLWIRYHSSLGSVASRRTLEVGMANEAHREFPSSLDAPRDAHALVSPTSQRGDN